MYIMSSGAYDTHDNILEVEQKKTHSRKLLTYINIQYIPLDMKAFE